MPGSVVSSFIGMWALELLGLSGQSTVLGGFALLATGLEPWLSVEFTADPRWAV